jgi:hypothetical protein
MIRDGFRLELNINLPFLPRKLEDSLHVSCCLFHPTGVLRWSVRECQFLPLELQGHKAMIFMWCGQIEALHDL